MNAASEYPPWETVTCLEISLSLESKFGIGQLALHFLIQSSPAMCLYLLQALNNCQGKTKTTNYK